MKLLENVCRNLNVKVEDFTYQLMKIIAKNFAIQNGKTFRVQLKNVQMDVKPMSTLTSS